jgi:hypothetical protein
MKKVKHMNETNSPRSCAEVHARKGRGRPALAHDNQRVQAFVSGFHTVRELADCRPQIDHIFTGASLLQTEGQGSTRPMSKLRLFLALRRCDTITSKAVAEALGGCPQATAVRYAALARVASKAIEQCLERHPDWETHAASLSDCRDADEPTWSGAAGGGEDEGNKNHLSKVTFWGPADCHLEEMQ